MHYHTSYPPTGTHQLFFPAETQAHVAPTRAARKDQSIAILVVARVRRRRSTTSRIDSRRGNRDAQHGNSIDVLSYSGAPRRRRHWANAAQDLQIGKSWRGKPAVFELLVKGANIPSMGAGGLRPGVAARISRTAQAGECSPPSRRSRGSAGTHENVSFSYSAVSQQYVPQRADGSLGPTVFAGWDAVNNQLIATYPNPCGT